jgi:predicted RNA-binding Zn-ribbon protein involved in translation (DUF1610 family)
MVMKTRRMDFSMDVRTLPQVAAEGGAAPADDRVVSISCPVCGHELRTRARNAGRRGRCPACAVEFTISHKLP